jgi:hypothetical protein
MTGTELLQSHSSLDLWLEIPRQEGPATHQMKVHNLFVVDLGNPLINRRWRMRKILDQRGKKCVLKTKELKIDCGRSKMMIIE